MADSDTDLELHEIGMSEHDVVPIDQPADQVNAEFGSNKKSRKSLKPNRKLKHETVQSLWNGDIEQVSQWVNSLPQTQRAELINQHTDTEGRKALHIACLHNQHEVAKILLEAGADPNTEDYEQRTALHCACSTGNVQKEPTTELTGCDQIDAPLADQEGSAALHSDAQAHHSDVVKLLLEKGAKLEARDKFGLTPVHWATGDVEKLTVLTTHTQKCVHFKLTDSDEPSQTLLHYAAEKGYSKAVDLLITKGANIEARDKFGLTPVHWATGDVDTLKVFISHKKGCVHYKNHHESTPLHYAAEKGHSDSVTLLLNNGADMTARDKDGLAPIHWATGDVKTLNVMMKENSDCVNWKGDDKDEETPLHFAARYGHLEGAKKLLSKKRNSGLVNVTNNKDKQTPLHYAAAYSKDSRLAEVLLYHRADAKALDCLERDPLYIACQYGNIGVVNVLLKHVKVKPKCLQVAVSIGNERIVSALLKFSNSDWPKLLRQTYTLDDGTETTPFREMIKTMPDIAEEILNRCTLINPKNKDPTNKDYEAIFNYEFIEDFRAGSSEDPTTVTMKSSAMESDHHDVGVTEEFCAVEKKFSMRDKKFGITFAEVKHRQNNSVSWGPVGFSMSNHPLAIMAKRSPKLLTHPLVRSAVHYKWKKFGQYAYYTNLFTYLLFLIFLTTFALLVPNPQTDECAAITGGLNNTTAAANPVECRSSKSVQAGVYLSACIVIVSALCRILLEVFQLIIYKLDYLMDWVNWSELIMYVSSIIFAWVFNTPCQCPYNWQWQIGAVAIFLGWFNLVLFFSKFPPFGGIYVLMFVKIIKTFLKICILSFLLVLAFALTFYMAFYEPSISRSPFSHPGRSILKTMSMTAGDFDFDSIFRQDPTGGGDTLDEIPFPPISYIVWIVFIVLMPVLLNNMLVGLAVGDTQSILKEAAETKLALQIEQVLTTEETIQKFLMCIGYKFRWNRTKRSIFPNKSFNFLKEQLKKLQFSLWGGDPYNTHDALQRALWRLGDQGKNNGQNDRDYNNKNLSKQVNSLKEQLKKIEEKVDKLVEGFARNADVGHTLASNL